MGDQPWLDSVREQLARHGLPPSYVQRFIEELGDHLEDLNEAGMEADAFSRLGEPKQVANAAVAAYRRRSLPGRHPVAAFLVFAISPVASHLLLFSIVALAIATALRLIPSPDGPASAHFSLAVLMALLSVLIVLLPNVVASLLYCKLVVRCGIDRK